MRYTWRISLTLIIMIGNGFNLYNNNAFTYTALLACLFNSAIGWLIGAQIDKYRLSKKELGSTKTALLDYSFALNSVNEAIGITTESGELEFFNAAYAKLFGYNKEEFSQVYWASLYTKETIDYFYDSVEPVLNKEGHWRGEGIGVRKDGTTFPQGISLTLIKESKTTISVVRDITEQKSYEEVMKYTAEHNDLTNLPNRRRLLTELTFCSDDLKDLSLLFIDLDRFKIINDNLGHEIGDELLKNVAKRLQSFETELIKVFHHGGDEFIILIRNKDVLFIKNISSEIVKSIKVPFYINGIEIYITTSIGISRYPDHTHEIHDLIKMADTAMYYAKLEGKDTFKIFNNELKLQIERKAIIESELRRAIKNEELFILYQPKFSLNNYEIVGIEALIRWEHPVLGIISPGEFIPIAEETGLITDIGRWVIHGVIQQMRIWQDKRYPLVKVSLNVSQRQFRDTQLVPTIESYLQLFNIDSKYLEIEITESVMEDLDLIIPILNTLKAMGVGISIDDFGTGYSSLNLLKVLPIDTLKIDQSFIRDLLENPKDYSLVKTILEIGNNLELKVVAEGVETEAHLKQLLQLKCPIGQGYYFSKPIHPAALENKFF